MARDTLAPIEGLLQRAPASRCPHAVVFIRQALAQIGGATTALDHAITLHARAPGAPPHA